MEESEDEEYWKDAACPLKRYLFGSSTELPETTEAKKEKASLQELFDRTKITTDYKEKSESEETEVKYKHKSAMRFMKKMIKKFHASSKSSGGDATDSVSIKKKCGEASDSLSTKKKPHKVLRMFHRTIHPESSIAAREFVKSFLRKRKANITEEAELSPRRLVADVADILNDQKM